MPYRTDVTYAYDGTFDGLMCCVFESFSKREMPEAVAAPGEEQMSLFERREIVTDGEKATRVKKAIREKISVDALDFIQRAFLTCMEEKERYIIVFIHKGFKYGRKIMNMLSDGAVDKLSKAVRHIGNEAHLLSGFIRFSIYGGIMAATITPKNFVLPVLAPHFMDRYPNERFVIYDKTHETVLAYENGKVRIFSAENFSMPEPDAEEMHFRSLWKMFYDTIAVEGRYNPKCRMSHMPKRYWENMTEFAWDRDYREKGRNRKADMIYISD